MTKNKSPRKFQVSRSHILDFKHLSRILHSLAESREEDKVSRSRLREETGLPDGQVESLISIGAAMGLIEQRVQTLTPAGKLVVDHDIFIEQRGTLEWCHYAGAGSYRNLFWFDVFNHLLVEETAMTIEGWQDYFTRQLSGRYSDKSIKDQVPKEVRFVVNAYLEGNFSKLDILRQTTDGRLYRRRYAEFDPLVFCAMIYDYCNGREVSSPEVPEMAQEPGSPAVIFGLDIDSFRQQIEGLHERGWLRYETTHNLNQIRLITGYKATDFLEAHYEGRTPQRNGKTGSQPHAQGQTEGVGRAERDAGSQDEQGDLFE